ncbi:hypothetical protein [Agriterribacter sp.]|uniref:hypothetical protein n=1 Tax=Agriterribacter sp. TaxID=2821509 RepID=UPI002BB184D6|nr:hypothetical protein [Agriterribacter sp.]HRO48279.1 helix-turn-helix domain-containing protein [Agriterribacter sp.]HRQ18470.1 helix-turn-helix domain-containing protein [Agriterribacter sp.]
MSKLQIDFFQYIRAIVPVNISLVDEIAEVLEISNDSAYRRMRGEKLISIEEIRKLSNHFRISVDQVLSLENNSILFSGSLVEPDKFDFLQYLDNIHKTLLYITGFSKKELICFSKDIPVFYYFMFPELAAFKFFAWMKTFLQFPEYKYSKFSLAEFPSEFLEQAKKIAALVCKVPFVEILNVENIQITLRQIEYYKDTGFFASQKEYETLYDKLYEMIDLMELQAVSERKFMPGQQPLSSGAPLKLYVNDFVLGDNSMLCVLDDKQMCIFLHNVMNVMMTQDERICNYSFDFIQNLISKSILISGVGERERYIFFNMIRQRIDAYRQNDVKTLSKPSPYF